MDKVYLLATHYHPYACVFIEQLRGKGINGLFERTVQFTQDTAFFRRDYIDGLPNAVDLPYPDERVDFDGGGSYALYNWELFFHAPFLIADRLSKNQQFDRAQQWFHYIFDPTRYD